MNLKSPMPHLEAILGALDMDLVILNREGVVVYVPPTSNPTLGTSLPQLGDSFACPDFTEALTAAKRVTVPEKIDGVSKLRTFIPAKQGEEDPNWVLTYSILAADDDKVVEALRASEERYRLLFEGSRDAIAVYGKGLKPILCNHHFAELTGYTLEEISDLDPLEAVVPEDRERIIRNHELRLRGESVPRIYEFRLIRKDGRIVPVEVSFDRIMDGEQIIGIQGIFRDITERKRLFEHLLEKQKEKSVITLAGGIAHDFNNILLGVIGNATLLEEELVDRPGAIDLLKTIQSSAQRMADLTSQLLSYARGGRYRPIPVDVNQTLNECIRSLKGSAGSGLVMECNLDEELGLATADRAQVSQVFLNIMVNAVEAMVDTGDLKISTWNHLQESDALFEYSQTLRAGAYVCAEIQDTGPGMSEETLSRVFEPFYTTKFIGRGLGLAAAFGIVQNHAGAIEVQSSLGSGSTFRVFIPRKEPT